MIILLAGPKGSGKTTTAMNLAARLRQAGIQVGGIICPGIFEDRRKIGIKSHYAATGHENLLGIEKNQAGRPVPQPTGPDTFSYGRWEFRRSALAAADEAIITDIEASRFVFVDEIGPLELDYGLGMIRTLARLDAGKDSGVIVVCTRQDLAQPLAERWPGSVLVELAEADLTSAGKTAGAILASIAMEPAARLGTSPGRTDSRDFQETIRELVRRDSMPGNAQA